MVVCVCEYIWLHELRGEFQVESIGLVVDEITVKVELLLTMKWFRSKVLRKKKKEKCSTNDDPSPVCTLILYLNLKRHDK